MRRLARIIANCLLLSATVLFTVTILAVGLASYLLVAPFIWGSAARRRSQLTTELLSTLGGIAITTHLQHHKNNDE